MALSRLRCMRFSQLMGAVVRTRASRRGGSGGLSEARSQRLGLAADELLVEPGLAIRAADRDDLVAGAQDRVRPQRRRDAAADDREERAALGDLELAGR